MKDRNEILVLLIVAAGLILSLLVIVYSSLETGNSVDNVDKTASHGGQHIEIRNPENGSKIENSPVRMEYGFNISEPFEYTVKVNDVAVENLRLLAKQGENRSFQVGGSELERGQNKLRVEATTEAGEEYSAETGFTLQNSPFVDIKRLTSYSHTVEANYELHHDASVTYNLKRGGERSYSRKEGSHRDYVHFNQTRTGTYDLDLSFTNEDRTRSQTFTVDLIN